MKREDAEDWRVVTLTSLAAIAGIVALRAGVRVGGSDWGLAYLAMGLTASIRWTSKGVGWSPWSLARGLACLQVAVQACQWLGYPTTPIYRMSWVPEEASQVPRAILEGIVGAIFGP